MDNSLGVLEIMNPSGSEALPQAPLNAAVLAGDLELVKNLCQEGADLEWFEPTNYATALIFAITYNNLEIAKHLVKVGADTNHSPRFDHCPLEFAISYGNVAMVQCLVDGGADVNKCQHSQHPKNKPPLSLAARRGNLEVVKILVAAGAIISKNPDHSPLAIAASDGHLALVQWLLESGVMGVDIRQIDPCILCFAVQHGHMPVVQCLLKAGVGANRLESKSRSTPLFCAARSGNLEITKLLLSAGATARLAGGKVQPIFAAIISGHLPVVECLVEAGADIHEDDYGGVTPILLASKLGQIEIVKFLSSMGAHHKDVKVRYLTMF